MPDLKLLHPLSPSRDERPQVTECCGCISESVRHWRRLKSKGWYGGTGDAACVMGCAYVCVWSRKDKEVELGWHKEAESDGFILARGVGGTQEWAPQRHPCQLVYVALCLSVCLNGSNLEIGSTTNKTQSCREQKQKERGGRREYRQE